MNKLERNAYWNIFKGKLIQRYALFMYGKKNEFTGRFQARIAMKQGFRTISRKLSLPDFFC